MTKIPICDVFSLNQAYELVYKTRMLDEMTEIRQDHLLTSLQKIIEELENTSAILASADITFIPHVYDQFSETAPYFDIENVIGHLRIVLTSFFRYGAPAHNAPHTNEVVFSMVTPSLLEQMEMALLRAKTQLEIYKSVLSKFGA